MMRAVFRQVYLSAERITESLSHETIEIASDPGSHLPKPLIKQGHLQLVAQNCVQTAFDYSKDVDPQLLCATCASVWSP